jgi:hypothetical protein
MAMETPNEQLMSFQPSSWPPNSAETQGGSTGRSDEGAWRRAAAKPLEWRVPLFSPNLLENYNHWKTIICFHHGFPIITGLV